MFRARAERGGHVGVRWRPWRVEDAGRVGEPEGDDRAAVDRKPQLARGCALSAVAWLRSLHCAFCLVVKPKNNRPFHRLPVMALATAVSDR